MSNHSEPAEEAIPTSKERWIYGGVRVLNDKRIHAWIDPDGHEGLYALKRTGNWAIGGAGRTQRFVGHAIRHADLCR